MTHRLKKLSLILLAFGANASYAAMFTPPPAPACVNGSVTTPGCSGNSWDIGIDGLYVQPLNQSSSIVQPRVIVNGNNIENINETFYPKWAGGFRLYGNFQFLDGKYIGADWTYFKRNTDQTNIITTNLPGISLVSLDQFTSNDIRFNEVNLKVGQILQVGERASINYYGGLRFAQINNDYHVRGTLPLLNNTLIANAQNDNKFRGVGPVLGAKISYAIANGFSLFGEVAGAVLIGTSNTNVRIATTLPGQPIRNLTENLDERRTVIAMDGKLGAQYTWTMPRGDLSIRAGWQATQYNSALTRVSTVFLCTTAPCNGFIVPSFGNHSFGYQGPFVGINGRFNA